MHWEGTLLLCAWHVIIFHLTLGPFQNECEELLSLQDFPSFRKTLGGVIGEGRGQNP